MKHRKTVPRIDIQESNWGFGPTQENDWICPPHKLECSVTPLSDGASWAWQVVIRWDESEREIAHGEENDERKAWSAAADEVAAFSQWKMLY
jgi:hypothetical protein